MFRDRSLAGMAFPYVFLDAIYCKTRVNHRVVSQAVAVATGVAADGHREVLGFDVGDSEDGAFWTAFLRSLRARGLGGVQLVISDSHAGLKAATGSVLPGAGKTTTRKRSARPAFSTERPRVRLPMVRIDLAAVSFTSRTASTGSLVTRCVSAQERGSLSVVEKTTFDRPARAPVPGSPPAANPDMRR